MNAAMLVWRSRRFASWPLPTFGKIAAEIEDGTAPAIHGFGVTTYLYVDGWRFQPTDACDRWLQMMNVRTPLKAAGFDWRG